MTPHVAKGSQNTKNRPKNCPAETSLSLGCFLLTFCYMLGDNVKPNYLPGYPSLTLLLPNNSKSVCLGRGEEGKTLCV